MQLYGDGYTYSRGSLSGWGVIQSLREKEQSINCVFINFSDMYMAHITSVWVDLPIGQIKFSPNYTYKVWGLIKFRV